MTSLLDGKSIICERNYCQEQGALMATTVENLLHNLKGRGVRAGDVVACGSTMQRGTAVQWLACRKAGFIPLFLPPERRPENELELSSLANAKVHFGFSNECTCNVTPYVDYDPLLRVSGLTAGSVIHATSATTGAAKLVVRNQEQLEAEVRKYVRRTGICETDVVLSTAPIWPSFGFGSAMLVCLKTGAKLVDMGRVLPRKILRVCESTGVTVLLG